MIADHSPAPLRPGLADGADARPARFTLDGDKALEQHLARTCARVLSGVRGLVPPHQLEAVLLRGGYGRGEGGVLRGPAGDRPYNDLEFYVALRGNRHVNEFRYHRRLEVLGEILTHLADAEIEFKITSLTEMATRPADMFSYDLVAGHRWLWGAAAAAELPGCEHHRIAATLPTSAAIRLLMNRCSGLLFARTRLESEPFTPAAGDFVRRNLAKVQLACGDAILTAAGRYDWSCRARHTRLAQIAAADPSPWLDAALRHHAIGVEFKLHPTAGGPTREELRTLYAEVTALARHTWLTLETRRLGRVFSSARAYAEDAGDQCPGTSPLRNLALNLRLCGLKLRLHPNPWCHPRQRVCRALALLLWEPAALTEPVLRGRLETELNAPLTDFSSALAAYRALWAHVR